MPSAASSPRCGAVWVSRRPRWPTRMGTSQSAVARFEAGDLDVRLSTVERYTAALGGKLEWRIERA